MAPQTAATLTPGASDSMTIASFCSSLKRVCSTADRTAARPSAVLSTPFRRRGTLSSAGNTAAYFRASTGMKPGAPVDRNLAAVDQITPAAQAVLRELRRRGILPDCHSAPVQRLHMHRPERLDRLIALIFGQLGTGAPCDVCDARRARFRQGFAFCARILATSASAIARSQHVNVVL